jgi:hypothetical protein
MGYTHTHYYETIIQRQIRAGRASNKSEVIHQALALLDAVTQGQGPAGACPHAAQTLMTLCTRYEPPPDDHSGAETGQGKERNEDDGPNSELGLRISFGVRLSVFGVLCGFAVPPSPFHL